MLLYLNPQITQKMKKPKVDLATKFFMAMRMTEILESAGDAISDTHQQLLWHHEDGDIMLDFSNRTISVIGNEHHPLIIAHFLQVCEHYDFELNVHTCDCSKCKEQRSQYN